MKKASQNRANLCQPTYLLQSHPKKKPANQEKRRLLKTVPKMKVRTDIVEKLMLISFSFDLHL